MTTDVSICNLALSRLGDAATVVSISPPEGSAQAEHCARFYPLARDSCLEAHAWKFATVTAPMTLMGASSMPWAYVYAEPARCLRLLSVLPPDTDEPQLFEAGIDEREQPIIYTNQANARVRFVYRVVGAERFPAHFVDALSWLLASYLAGAVMRDDTGRRAAAAAYQGYLGALDRARTVDAQQQRVEATDVRPSWITKR